MLVLQAVVCAAGGWKQKGSCTALSRCLIHVVACQLFALPIHSVYCLMGPTLGKNWKVEFTCKYTGYKNTIRASEALTETDIPPPLTVTLSVACVPVLTHCELNDVLPPIVTAAPWSTSEVALGAVILFACFVPDAVRSPVKEIADEDRVPVPL